MSKEGKDSLSKATQAAGRRCKGPGSQGRPACTQQGRCWERPAPGTTVGTAKLRPALYTRPHMHRARGSQPGPHTLTGQELQERHSHAGRGRDVRQLHHQDRQRLDDDVRHLHAADGEGHHALAGTAVDEALLQAVDHLALWEARRLRPRPQGQRTVHPGVPCTSPGLISLASSGRLHGGWGRSLGWSLNDWQSQPPAEQTQADCTVGCSSQVCVTPLQCPTGSGSPACPGTRTSCAQSPFGVGPPDRLAMMPRGGTA